MPKPPQLAPSEVPRLDSFLKREAEQCDTITIAAHSLVPLFVNGGHHLCLTLQRFCPEPPRDTEKECQTRQPNNVQSLQRLRANLIHPWHLAAGQLRDTLSDLCRGFS